MNSPQLVPRRPRSRRRTFLIAFVIYGSCVFYFLFQGGKTSFMLLSMATVLAVYWACGWFGGVTKVKGQRMVRTGTSRFLPAQSRIAVAVELRVPGWLPLPYVIVQDGLYRFDELYSQAEAAVTLKAGRQAVWTYRTPPLPRGSYRLDATTCFSKDLFGIFEQRGQFHTPSSFFILPATVPIPSWAQAGHQAVQPGQAQAVDKRKRESTQLSGVREYVHGDRLSRIHWNATAKSGSLKSKQFDQEVEAPILIVLDIRGTSYENSAGFEMALSAAASIAQYAKANRHPAYLAAIGGSLHWWDARVLLREPAAYKQWLSTLEPEPPTSQVNDRIGPMLAQRAALLRGAAVAWISGAMSTGDMAAIGSLRSIGGSGTFIHAAASGPDEAGWPRALAKQGFQYIWLDELNHLPKLLGGGMTWK
ncbi:MAG: DUF58 domain-containing protein [Paenibacillus dendritiformis]|uniref:DUF58 domain-containing protein n=1 Tax=Paenibacillus dendritiformis TaxID=130049 RepID=UPI00143D725E|nr:DUF58 domain-containing protein [Paenibacillus dendritiformis]MDU5141397.1 DUF58 domain-containing protein [Paenibacillus dendritiformis]NKI21091.1 DUF58 domain-containing protein [Paenibacillus dendritiformis]NRF96652.1 DUF58 domain-containing protein [Paenibacillus dendritiformis]GIO72271.1 hypothetical protein J27TS7_17850 [Paenibacillus dendritiformis]